tara:strand:+ start:6517 stop:7077 length:561 start_codon:yes stop_codon:yes gene_type:complete
MKNLVVALAILAMFVGYSQEKSIDLSSSKLQWEGRERSSKTHYGGISFKSGDLKLEGAKIKGGSFIVDMTTLDVQDLTGGGKSRLEGHLRSDDFFSVEANPQAFLILNSVLSDSNGIQILQGDLTIKGKTAPVQVEFSEVTTTMAVAKMIFDRSVYDVRFRSGSFFENLGDKLIYDDIAVQVNLNF